MHALFSPGCALVVSQGLKPDSFAIWPIRRYIVVMSTVLKNDPGPIEIQIRAKLEAAFSPTHLDLVNESHSHSVPHNSETHFKLVLVSAAFDGLSRIARQRKVYDVLKAELAPGGVHALTQRILTPDEWTPEAVATFESPDCHGGTKK
jgi:BolA protein